MEHKPLYLNQDEIMFMQMSVLQTLDIIQKDATDQRKPYTPEARSKFKEMLVVGESIKSKLQQAGFDIGPLPPGDTDKYFTKPS